MAAASTSSSSAPLIQDILLQLNSRRLLLHTPLYQPQSAPSPLPGGNSLEPPQPAAGENTFDANVVMVLSVLLCALICSLGLNSIIRCAIRCSTFVSYSSSGHSASVRLANTGIKKKALKTFPVVNYTSDLKLPGLDSECAICLSEFAPNERVKVLPKCNHGFHVRCIDKWLTSHSSCPTCRHCLLETCQKIVGCSQASTSGGPPSLSPPIPEVAVRIEPLTREGLIYTYQT